MSDRSRSQVCSGNRGLRWALLAALVLPGVGADAQEGIQPRDPETALKSFRSRYRSNEAGVRLASLQIVIPFESADLCKAIRDVIIRDEAMIVRNAAVQVMGHWGSTEAAQYLIEACASGKLPIPTLDLAGDTMGRMYDDGARKLVRTVTASSHRDVRYATTRALGGYQGAADVEQLALRLEDKDAGVRRQAARALSQFAGAPGDAETLAGAVVAEKFRGERNWHVKVAMVEMLAALEVPAGRALLTEATQDKELAVSCTAAKWLGVYEGTFETLRDLITSRQYPLGAAAVRGLARSQNIEIIPVLIDRIDQVHRRVQGEILYVLERLTGKKIGPHQPSWTGWWEANRIGFNPEWDAPYAEGSEELEDVWNLDGEGEAPGEATVTFFGLELYTKNVVFVLDTSKSMLERSYHESYKLADGSADTRAYIDRVKDELLKSIRNLPLDVRFNVYFFDSDVRKVFYKMTPATRANKATAMSKSKGQSAKGLSTNFYRAFNEVWDEDGEIDTIVFLSDGTPTDGPITEPHLLLDWILDANRERNCTIHTISVGKLDEMLDYLMRSLAATTGGRFIHR